jgi:hypothetical protein
MFDRERRRVAATVVSVLEPGRKRRHPMPPAARRLWAAAAGFTLMLIVAFVLR